VFAVRKNREEGLFKRVTSAMFWWLISNMTGLKIVPNQAMLRIMNVKVCQAILQFTEPTLFIAGMFAWVGFRSASIEIRQEKRLRGKSKYSITKMLQLTLNAILGFSDVPLYYISYLGISMSLLSIVYGLIVIIRHLLFHAGVVGWSSLIVVLTFLGGMIIFSIGVLGIYLGKVHEHTLQRPRFIIKQRI
jgi:dolichol-phosphate mannosyltransferase